MYFDRRLNRFQRFMNENSPNAYNIFKQPDSSVSQESCTESFGAVTSSQPDNSVTVWKTEVISLYGDMNFSDFHLKCNNVIFPVHKDILSARSPVFDQLFQQTPEALSDCMDIADLDLPTLDLFLTFLYTGAVDNLLSDAALKLYYAADKYQVPTLKKECADFLSDNISIENTCDVLSLAHKHQDDSLTSAARDFILANYNEVLESKEWESLMHCESFLARETLTHFAQIKNMPGKNEDIQSFLK